MNRVYSLPCNSVSKTPQSPSTFPHAAGLLSAVRARLAAHQGFALATINLDHLVKLKSDPPSAAPMPRRICVVADGNPIVWLSKAAGRPVSLVPGSEMVLPLARLAAQTGRKVALLGATEETLHKAADRHPG